MHRWLLLLAGLLVIVAVLALPARGGPRFDDPLLPQQWALDLVKAPEAWTRSTGAGVRIAIIDSGVDLGHEDLRVLGGTSFGGCETVPEGCGDGGWLDPEPPEPPSDPIIRLGWQAVQILTGAGVGETGALLYVHGTQVAGIAAATGGNGRGIAGVAPQAGVLSVNVDNGDGYTFDAVAAGVRWATRHGAHVINLSLGATGPAVHDAVAEAVAAGVVVVAAAGNHAVPPCFEPAALPGVVCAVAADREGLPTWFSNRAFKNDNLVVAAPSGSNLRVDPHELDPCGSQVLTLMPSKVARPCDETAGRPRGYGMFSGTSAAAPHVAGLAALLAAQCRDAAEIVDVIMRTARNPVTGMRGQWDPLWGRGLIDAAAAVAEPVRSQRAGCIVQ